MRLTLCALIFAIAVIAQAAFSTAKGAPPAAAAKPVARQGFAPEGPALVAPATGAVLSVPPYIYSRPDVPTWALPPGSDGVVRAIGLMKRYYPYPDLGDRAMPRLSMLDIHVPADALLYVDDQHVPTQDGFYRFDSKLPLIPGVEYVHEVRVERIANGQVVAVREVDVWLRMGRLTELTFY